MGWPYCRKKICFFYKKRFDIKISSLDDASKYEVGVQRGGVTENFLDSEGFPNVEGINKPEQNLAKLMKGRIQLWYDSNATMAIACKKLNMKTSKLKELFVVKTSLLYIAFNKSVSNKVISKWQKTYDKLHKNGQVKKIFRKYELETLYPKYKKR